MNVKNTHLSFVLLFLTITPTLFSCGEKEQNNLSLEPVIISVSPGSGKPGDILTITGSRFGVDKSKVKVQFNATVATNIVSVVDNKIEVEVPAAIGGESAVYINVLVANLSSNKIPFSLLKPTSITSVTATCFYGSTVVISGTNFSPNAAENVVMFDDKEAVVTEATSTSLTVITPDLGNAETSTLTVITFGMVSNSARIDVDPDQNKIATYNWTTHIVKPGVIYKTGQFTLFGPTTRRIHVLDVTLDDNNPLGIGFSATNKTTVDMCRDYYAVAGINAGYFPMQGSSNKDPYIRINGVTVQNGHLDVNPIFTNSALLIQDNVAKVRKLSGGGNNLNHVAAAIPVSEAENVIVSGPILITNGIIESQNMNHSHNSSSTARTGFGITADGKRVFMVVVDYNQGATGVQTPQLAKILQALGAVYAMNFDGGGSSTMFVEHLGDNGRVSINTYPQRAVRSVIYVK